MPFSCFSHVLKGIEGDLGLQMSWKMDVGRNKYTICTHTTKTWRGFLSLAGKLCREG